MNDTQIVGKRERGRESWVGAQTGLVHWFIDPLIQCFNDSMNQGFNVSMIQASPPHKAQRSEIRDRQSEVVREIPKNFINGEKSNEN